MSSFFHPHIVYNSPIYNVILLKLVCGAHPVTMFTKRPSVILIVGLYTGGEVGVVI